jgi:hypothetical protein
MKPTPPVTRIHSFSCENGKVNARELEEAWEPPENATLGKPNDRSDPLLPL